MKKLFSTRWLRESKSRLIITTMMRSRGGKRWPHSVAMMRILCTVLVSFSLVACSSSGESSGDSNTTISKYGYLSVSLDTREQFNREYTESNIRATFMGFTSESNLTVNQFVNDFETQLSHIDGLIYGDTLGCIDRNEIEPLSLPAELPETGLDTFGIGSIRDISAGEVITITSPTGSWLELAQHGEDGRTDYYHPGRVEGYPAAGTTVDIPGDEFPPFANLQIPYMQPLLNMRAEFTDAGAGPRFTVYWEPGVDANNKISLRIITSDSEDRLIGVSCLVPDTGTFTVPAEFDYLFQKSDPQLYRLFMNRFRRSYSYSRQDNVVVFIDVRASGEN